MGKKRPLSGKMLGQWPQRSGRPARLSDAVPFAQRVRRRTERHTASPPNGRYGPPAGSMTTTVAAVHGKRLLRSGQYRNPHGLWHNFSHLSIPFPGQKRKNENAARERKAVRLPAPRFFRILLLGSEDPVARIAQTGDDIGVLVEPLVHRADEDVHVGMVAAHDGDALRRGDDVH